MPLTRRQIYRRRRIAVFGGLALLVGGIAYLPLTLFAPLATITPTVTEQTVAASEAAQLPVPPGVASAIRASGDGLLAQNGSTEALPMASITKLVAALVVLDAHPLAAGESGPSVTMTAADAALYRHYDGLGASVAPVKAGSVYTELELLQIMLIDSAGNYAVTVTNWAFGSQDAFLDAARAWLDAQGLSSVIVTEPTGREPANVATTSDLLTIGELALAQPALASIVATSEITIHDVGKVVNSNKLLGINGIDGIKTGTLNNFGANLLFSADIAVGETTVPVVGVVLGALTHGDLNAGVVSLLEKVMAGYHEVPLVEAGTPVGEYSSRWGDTASAVTANGASLLVWSDTPIEVATTVEPMQLGTDGDPVGSLVYTAGHRSVTVPLVLSATIDDPGPWWRLSHPEIIFGMG